MFTVSNAILTEIVYQVCMDLIGSFPASHGKCLFTRAPLRNFVWICMYVKPIFSETSLCYCTKSIALATVMFTLGSDWVSYITFFLVSDSYGLFNFLLPGTSLYSAIESSSLLVSDLQ